VPTESKSLHGGQTDEDESQNKPIHPPHLFLDFGLKPKHMKHNFYHTIISLKEATEKLHQGIAQGLYGSRYHLRMLQFHLTIIGIGENHFQFGMFKHYGVFHANISPEIATHWGITLPLKKNSPKLSNKHEQEE